jgi:hypothetical protein
VAIIFARNDIRSINVSEGAGGCAETHVRPVDPDGKPVTPWGVDCVQCEAFLLGDPMWTPHLEELPETYDEERSRKSLAINGGRAKDALLTELARRIAGVGPAQISPVLQKMISANAGPAMACPAGHVVTIPGSKFCGTCGSTLIRAEGPKGLTA